jgi:subtilisin family serine protease
VLEYAEDDAYMCHFPPTDLQAVRALPFVRWAGPFSQAFKIAPELTVAPPSPVGRNLMAMAALPHPVLDSTEKTVDVVLHRNVQAADTFEAVLQAAHVDKSAAELGKRKVRLTVPVRHLPEIARLDVVHHIEEARTRKLHNDVVRTILRVPVGENPATVLEGEGQVVAVCDTGFDRGSASDVHPAFTGRVVHLYALGRPNLADDPHDHGTHVAGSVLGHAHSDTLGLDVRGTAPQAQLVLQSVLDGFVPPGFGGIPGDLNTLFEPPYTEHGARVHTNSWGDRVGDGAYDSQAEDVDEFVWEHRDMVICFSAGNEGVDTNADGRIDARSITPPATAKNCVTVGASENQRPNQSVTWRTGFGYPANPIADDRVADNPEGMVAFSSRGPTAAGRIKPDVAAPGSFILSTRSRRTSSLGWSTTADDLYFFNGGTSMACPLVAGCAALVREFFIKRHDIDQPSAALVKALLINGASDLTGQYTPSEAGEIPNDSEGFGRVDVTAVVDPYPPGTSLQFFDEATEMVTAQSEERTVNVIAGATVKATLLWSDFPGSSLQNDLDLIVRALSGTERHGNRPPGDQGFDRKNNVEQVIFTSLPAGTVRIIVRAHRITHPQSYALVVRVS